jgi:hypothetical protein
MEPVIEQEDAKINIYSVSEDGNLAMWSNIEI